MKRGRRIQILIVTTILVLAYGTGTARAETTGDLYLASAAGLLEVVTSSATVLDTVPVTPGPGPIAIRPDGRELFALAGSRRVVGVDLESMAVTSRIDLPAAGAAIAHPRGDQLVIAMPSLRQLAIRDAGSATLDQSEPLPGAVDLLAADRRDGRVVAAAAAGRWVAVFDPGTGSIRTATVNGGVTAVALDAAEGVVVVATTKPDRVVGLDLVDFGLAWSISLSDQPTAVAVATTMTLVAADRNVWALDHAALGGRAVVGASTSDAQGHRWATLAKPATALAVSDDGTLVYALEADRVEGFVLERPSTDASSATANRTIKLAGSQAPLAIATVPGAEPLLGGPGNAVASGRPIPGDAGTSRNDRPGIVPPRTDTVLDEPARWLGASGALPQAIVVGAVILILGVLAVRRYEHGYREPVKVPSRDPSGRE